MAEAHSFSWDLSCITSYWYNPTLLNDQEWITGLKRAIQEFLENTRTLSRYHQLPHYPLVWEQFKELRNSYIVLYDHLEREFKLCVGWEPLRLKDQNPSYKTPAPEI